MSRIFVYLSITNYGLFKITNVQIEKIARKTQLPYFYLPTYFDLIFDFT